jgi:hypothetical protein
MPDILSKLAELDERITLVRENLRDLIEQAAGLSGAAGEELVSERIAEQQAELERLTKERDALAQSQP